MKYYALETKEKNAELYIFGDISSYAWREKDKDAYSIVKDLQKLQEEGIEEIDVHINSNGGSVSEGLAIYNVLKNSQMEVRTICDGFACSAASVVFMAGKERIMNKSSLLMIHNAWTYSSGNASDFRKKADDLEKITQASVDAYLTKVSLSEEEVKKMLNEETWISAEDAVTYGFATQVRKETEEGVKQSVSQLIHDKILEKESKVRMVMTEENILQIADAISEKINKEHKITQKNNWSDFFNA